jgi:hypothetical protein
MQAAQRHNHDQLQDDANAIFDGVLAQVGQRHSPTRVQRIGIRLRPSMVAKIHALLVLVLSRAQRQAPKPQPPAHTQAPQAPSSSPSAQDLAAQVDALARAPRSPQEQRSEAGMAMGARTSVLLPPLGDNACPRELRARYVLVEASDLQTSHDPKRGFVPRSGYPAELQPRDYQRDPSEQLKVTRGAGCLQPQILISTSADGLSGPPVLIPGGAVAGGNGRGMMMLMAYRDHPERGAAYKDHLLRHSQVYGIEPQAVAQMQSPILARLLDDAPSNLKALGHDLNTTVSNLQDAIHTAVAEAQRITPELASALAEVDPDVPWSEWLRARPDVRRLIAAALPSGFASSVFDKRGDLTESGQTWLSWALIARLLPDAGLLEMLGPGLRQSLVYGAPYALGAAEEGGPAWDVRPDLPRAVALVSAARAQGVRDIERLEAGGLMLWAKAQGVEGADDPTDGASPRAFVLAQILLTRPGPRQQREGWKTYLAAAKTAHQVNLFGERAEPFEELRKSFALESMNLVTIYFE